MEPSDLKREGYSQEDAYFDRINQDLIGRRRRELDAERAAQPDRTRETYWMKCPKCGAEMSEVDLVGIKVDQCAGCNGVYFDNGEWQTLLQSKESQGFFRKIKDLL